MRITIGGVLLAFGLGSATTYFVLEPARVGEMKERFSKLSENAMSLVGLFKSGGEETSQEAYNPPPPFGGSESSTSTVVENSTAAAVIAPTPEPVEVVPTPTPQPKVKTTRSKRRRVRSAPAASVTTAKKKTPTKRTSKSTAKPTAAKPTPPKSNMIGTYVSLELITGRAVQGILEGKTATHYVLNVPGLGPLEYPIENVKTVQPAQ